MDSAATPERAGTHAARLSYLAPKLLSHLEGVSHSRVLDIGSGYGSLCAEIRDRLGADVVGIEHDAERCALARRNHPGIPFLHRSLYDDDIVEELTRQGGFDVVVSTDVIEHLYYPGKLIEVADLLLLEGGTIIISTPYHGYAKNLCIALLNKWDDHHQPLSDGGHIKFWSRRTLARLFKEYGYSETFFTCAGRFPPISKNMILAYRKN